MSLPALQPIDRVERLAACSQNFRHREVAELERPEPSVEQETEVRGRRAVRN
jgi:hypothetical protein